MLSYTQNRYTTDIGVIFIAWCTFCINALILNYSSHAVPLKLSWSISCCSFALCNGCCFHPRPERHSPVEKYVPISHARLLLWSRHVCTNMGVWYTDVTSLKTFGLVECKTWVVDRTVSKDVVCGLNKDEFDQLIKA
jgi:hypothetical protein